MFRKLWKYKLQNNPSNGMIKSILISAFISIVLVIIFISLANNKVGEVYFAYLFLNLFVSTVILMLFISLFPSEGASEGECEKTDFPAATSSHLNLITRTKARLDQQLLALGVRARLSLLVGVALSLGCAGYIAYSLTLPTSGNLGPHDVSESLVKDYLPRASVVILIQLISLYLLRLHTRTLNEIRYVQNELTNIDFWLAALHLARETGDLETQKAVFQKFLNIEQVHLLEKGQTNLHLEREKFHAMQDKDMLEQMTKLIHGKDGRGLVTRR